MPVQLGSPGHGHNTPAPLLSALRIIRILCYERWRRTRSVICDLSPLMLLPGLPALVCLRNRRLLNILAASNLPPWLLRILGLQDLGYARRTERWTFGNRVWLLPYHSAQRSKSRYDGLLNSRLQPSLSPSYTQSEDNGEKAQKFWSWNSLLPLASEGLGPYPCPLEDPR